MRRFLFGVVLLVLLALSVAGQWALKARRPASAPMLAGSLKITEAPVPRTVRFVMPSILSSPRNSH